MSAAVENYILIGFWRSSQFIDDAEVFISPSAICLPGVSKALMPFLVSIFMFVHAKNFFRFVLIS